MRCLLALLLAAPALAEKCPKWCEKHKSKWEQKCKWQKCKDCSTCSSDPQQAQGECAYNCGKHQSSWNVKCTWDGCSGCKECKPPCKPWCAEHEKPWEAKCAWENCAGCGACPTVPPAWAVSGLKAMDGDGDGCLAQDELQSFLVSEPQGQAALVEMERQLSEDTGGAIKMGSMWPTYCTHLIHCSADGTQTPFPTGVTTSSPSASPTTPATASPTTPSFDEELEELFEALGGNSTFGGYAEDRNWEIVSEFAPTGCFDSGALTTYARANFERIVTPGAECITKQDLRAAIGGSMGNKDLEGNNIICRDGSMNWNGLMTDVGLPEDCASGLSQWATAMETDVETLCLSVPFSTIQTTIDWGTWAASGVGDCETCWPRVPGVNDAPEEGEAGSSTTGSSVVADVCRESCGALGFHSVKDCSYPWPLADALYSDLSSGGQDDCITASDIAKASLDPAIASLWGNLKGEGFGEQIEGYMLSDGGQQVIALMVTHFFTLISGIIGGTSRLRAVAIEVAKSSMRRALVAGSQETAEVNCFPRETLTCRLAQDVAGAQQMSISASEAERCFTDDTPPAGLERVAMADLRAGDFVLTGGQSHGAPTFERLLINYHKHQQFSMPLLTLTYDGGSLTMTDDHLLFIDGALKRAAHAVVGSRLSLLSGEAVQVTQIAVRASPIVNPWTTSATIYAADPGSSRRPVLATTSLSCPGPGDDLVFESLEGYPAALALFLARQFPDAVEGMGATARVFDYTVVAQYYVTCSIPYRPLAKFSAFLFNLLDIFIAFMIGPERIGPSLLLLGLLRRYGPRVYRRGTFRGAKA